jgi:hypothetical protein
VSDRQSCPEPSVVPTCYGNSKEHIFMISHDYAAAERHGVPTAGVGASEDHVVAVVDAHGVQQDRLLMPRTVLIGGSPY